MSSGNPLYHEVTPFASGEAYHPGGWRQVPEIFHDDTQVRGFFGPYRWLSNFAVSQVQLDDVVYPSVERAYQAAKWTPEARAFFAECTDEESITYNRRHSPNAYTADEWDAVKRDIMQHLVQQKFDPTLNPQLAAKLLDTGDRYLEETNWWGDEYWGRSLNGEGLNTLGELIMQQRDRLVLRRQAATKLGSAAADIA